MPDEPATATGTPRTGWTRPVAVPADIDDSSLDKAGGVIELPVHVSWSGPRIQWDLADRRQRARVYEIVLSEAPTTTSGASSTSTNSSTCGTTYGWRRTSVTPGPNTSSASVTSVWRAEPLPAGGGPASPRPPRSCWLRSGWRSRTHRDWDRRARDRRPRLLRSRGRRRESPRPGVRARRPACRDDSCPRR